MSTVIRALDDALDRWRTAHPGQPPVAIRLGERLLAQLLLDIAAAPQPIPHLETERGRPTFYHEIEILPDDRRLDEVLVL